MHLTETDQKRWLPSPKHNVLKNTVIDEDEASE